MKRLLKNNLGMTLMEILVALSLLMIIIVGTTPVMLQAYNGLYTAGEKTQETYEAKSEIEEKLATRNSRDVYNPGFTVNFNNLGEVATINGRRAVSSLYGSLETLFSNARVRVAVISSRTVNDDYAGDGYHEVILQTTNLDFGTTNPEIAKTKISVNKEEDVKDEDETREKIIDITFLIPKKWKKVVTDENQPDKYEIVANNDAAIYSYENGDAFLANVKKNSEGYPICELDPVTGRITLYINGFDFTQSPIKILVSYLDENNRKQTTETYLYVDTPTIIAAGETKDYDYYTSPGVVVKSVSTENGDEIIKTETQSFDVYGRNMHIDERKNDIRPHTYSAKTVNIDWSVTALPDNTIIKNVTWVNNDETTNSVQPYYVLTGTNGAIYRTYSFTGVNSELTELINPLDKPYVITERSSSKTVYPALWSGDKAHQFGYSTYDKSMGYTEGSDKCWYTEAAPDTAVGHEKAEALSTAAQYAYYYNGRTMKYTYETQKVRKISYILTEIGFSARRGGTMADVSNFKESFNKVWEQHGTGYDGKAATDDERDDDWTWYFRRRTSSYDTTLPLYSTKDAATTKNGNTNSESSLAQIRIKMLTTCGPTYMKKCYNDAPGSNESDVSILNHAEDDHSKITVTDAVYIPSLEKMFYTGTVAAYALLYQSDYVTEENNWHNDDEVKNGSHKFYAAKTGYTILSNDDSTATTVYKYPYWHGETDPLTDLKDYTSQVGGTGTKANTETAHNFFVCRTHQHSKNGPLTSILFNDVLFTMGFASNREMVYSEIVYGMKNGSAVEAYKGAEPYYFLSHWGSTTHIPTFYLNHKATNYINKVGYSNMEKYFNSPDNDYYNVWFPGEMYNLTKIATKENVTVAVGYSVSGSAYQFIDQTADSNTSTALGGIYNDGVLSCMIDTEDTAMSSLLYYKEKENFDNHSLTDGKLKYIDKDGKEQTLDYNNNNGDEYYYQGTSYYGDSHQDYNQLDDKGYGTHSRDSVQFTAVDIGVHYTESSDNVEKATFYAYYADNKGRVFRSKVAVRETDMPKDYDPEDEETNAGYERSTPVKVKYISDVIVQTGDSKLSDDTVGYMEQLHCHDGNDERTTCTFDWLFSKITTIKVEGKYLLVSGHPNQENAAVINQFGIPIVVGKIDETTGEINQWNIACLQTANATKYNVEDMFISDGRVYVAGTCEALSSTNPGFVAVLNLSDVEPNFRASNLLTEATSYPLVSVQVPDKLYAIAGK